MNFAEFLLTIGVRLQIRELHGQSAAAGRCSLPDSEERRGTP